MWKIVFQAVPLAAWALSLAVVVRPMSLTRRGAAAASAAIAAALSKFAVFALAGGDPLNPDLPAPAIWALSWAYAAAMALIIACAAVSLACLVLRFFRLRPAPRARRRCVAALAAAAAALAAWGVAEGVRLPTVRRVEIAWEDLPEPFDGYRIVHLSDLHCSTAARRGRFERMVETVNGLSPDLVAITGDFVDGTVAERRGDLEPLAKLVPRDGTVACTGNHERYWDWPGWYGALRGWGIEFPEMTGPRIISREGGVLAVGALPDPAFLGNGAGRGGRVPSAASAFSAVPADAFRILLFHRPLTAAPQSEESRVRLQLSGHTHGGAMPLVDLLVARANEGRTRGTYGFGGDGGVLHLSPGSGQWAGFPLRFFNPQEITEIVLRRRRGTKDPDGAETGVQKEY